jgi:hypothetical protein
MIDADQRQLTDGTLVEKDELVRELVLLGKSLDILKQLGGGNTLQGVSYTGTLVDIEIDLRNILDVRNRHLFN